MIQGHCIGQLVPFWGSMMNKGWSFNQVRLFVFWEHSQNFSLIEQLAIFLFTKIDPKIKFIDKLEYKYYQIELKFCRNVSLLSSWEPKKTDHWPSRWSSPLFLSLYYVQSTKKINFLIGRGTTEIQWSQVSTPQRWSSRRNNGIRSSLWSSRQNCLRSNRGKVQIF